jgi:serine/threonine protein kinase
MPKKIFETATNTYTEDALLGQGGAGTVFRVLDADGQPFALKCLNASQSVKRRRFKNELWFCQQEQHANIIRVVDSGVLLDRNLPSPFYVMPLFDGTLRTLTQNSLPPDRVLPLFDQVLSGVQAAHLKSVFHRDLKPENILYDRASRLLVVADFGIAHFGEDELLTAVETRNQERLANFIYAAPEQGVRGGLVDQRADIFALGLILNEMFTGTPPIAAGYPLIGGIAANYGYLDQIVDRMIQYSPEERYAEIGKVKEELRTRGNEFVALQRLDTAKRAVVPAFAPDDPLKGQDVKTTDFDWEDGVLRVGLDPTPPPAWRQAMASLGEFSYIGLSQPQNVRFQNGKAIVPCDVPSVAQVYQFFKQWVDRANTVYRQGLIREAHGKEQQERQRLDQQRKAAEERAQALANLRKVSG